MAKKDNNIQGLPAQLRNAPEGEQTQASASVRPMPAMGPVPVAPAPANVQLTPIVQPVAFVPYSTQRQPLFMMEDMDESTAYPDYYPENGGGTAAAAAYPYQEAAAPRAKAKRNVGGTSILLILLVLAFAAVLLIGHFVEIEFLAVLKTETEAVFGVTLITTFIDSFDFSADTFGLVLLGAAAFGALTLIGSLFSLTRKGASIFVKIMAFLFAACMIVLLVLSFVDDVFTGGIGLYILVGIAVLAMILAFVTRRQKK